MASALRDATNEEKADLYQELGLDLTYDPWPISFELNWCQGVVHLGVSEEGFAHLDPPFMRRLTWADEPP